MRPSAVICEPGNRLAQGLSDRGIQAQIEQVYSSFNDAETNLHYTFFLASCGQNTQTDNAEWVDIGDLADLTYASKSLHHMMTRYALEARVRSQAHAPSRTGPPRRR